MIDDFLQSQMFTKYRISRMNAFGDVQDKISWIGFGSALKPLKAVKNSQEFLIEKNKIKNDNYWLNFVDKAMCKVAFKTLSLSDYTLKTAQEVGAKFLYSVSKSLSRSEEFKSESEALEKNIISPKLAEGLLEHVIPYMETSRVIKHNRPSFLGFYPPPGGLLEEIGPVNIYVTWSIRMNDIDKDIISVAQEEEIKKAVDQIRKTLIENKDKGLQIEGLIKARSK